MHILITDPHTDGGGQVRYIQSLACELVQMGHQVTVASRANSVLVDVAQEAGCAALPLFYFARGFRLGQWLRDIWTMRVFIAQNHPDIVHVNGSQDHWVVGFVKLLFLPGACVLRTRHNTYVVKNTVVNRLLNRRLTTWQICVCEMVRATLSKHGAFDAERMVAIHNGVDAQAYRPQPEVRDAVRLGFGYQSGHVVCGIAARLVKAKGHTYLLEALAVLKEDFPTLRLLILGQGVLEESLKAQTKQLGLEAIVQFGGFRQDMARCIQAFDIGILPSIDCDTSSFSLKEQMAAEIPVITSDYGGLTEIVTDGEEGLVVPHGTVDPLVDALRTLLYDAGQRRRMGRKGRERVLRDFTGAVFATKTVEAYRKALEVSK